MTSPTPRWSGPPNFDLKPPGSASGQRIAFRKISDELTQLPGGYRDTSIRRIRHWAQHVPRGETCTLHSFEIGLSEMGLITLERGMLPGRADQIANRNNAAKKPGRPCAYEAVSESVAWVMPADQRARRRFVSRDNMFAALARVLGQYAHKFL